ncbi:hypothetical protein MSIMFB_04535 [Mycobacterium simulans]|uniref:Uncharacterized protein n=1 Tax=Mycobacterium simulans TaxID=627089 RepID=A0A7Z7INU7_9MYCO|nr:hypothetical protein MSIMFB_04535 [Mycobacterium simulans]
MTSPPWSRAGSPSVTLPPPSAPGALPPAAAPFPGGFPQKGRAPRRVSLWAVLGLLVAVVVSAVITATVTAVTMRSSTAVHPDGQPSAEPTAPASPTPQFSPAEVSAAKDHLCKVFDLSVRGQEGQGGFRVQGNVNVPIVLRALNSASAVQNALTPAVPSDVAAAARRYIATTLDVTTAAMGIASTPEVNRLTDVDGDAIDAFLDSCGLPR